MDQTTFSFSVPPATRQRLVHPARLDSVCRQWGLRFEKHFSKPFEIKFTNNTSTMISSRNQSGRLQLRLHNMFIEANDLVLKSLADYLQGLHKGDRRLDRYIRQNANRVGRRRLANSLGAVGLRFDLSTIRDALNRAYFKTPVDIPVVWARTRRRRKQRSIRLGSYSFEDRVIRIHSALDQDFVPAYVVVGVVYHEMLHHDLGAVHTGGRCLVHTGQFRKRERAFVHHRRAEAWEKKNLSKLIKPPASGISRYLAGRVHQT
ncbi:MAG: hypothetical protein JRJ87_22640 [Deltaproteobacteria bacterium]|nr:hypothetical protein [Deltaproteobacteria bacterium]